MNKFMGGLTLGIIATSCFFLLYHPFQKRAVMRDTTMTGHTIDSLPVPDSIPGRDGLKLPGGSLLQNQARPGRDSVVVFARTLLGTPYLFGSTDPAKGFDCSGFITYVFNHFKMVVPRSSYDFANVGKKVTLNTCRPGDLILFTGTDPLERTIGHIGIVSDTTRGNLFFIHSSSGKANGVTITSMDNKFYQERFMEVIDVLF